MLRDRFLFAPAICGLMLVAAAAVGQSTATGTVTGSVTDESAQPLRGATVMAVEGRRDTVSGADGSYTLRLPPGDYTILATASGRQTLQERVTVSAEESTTVNFSLGPTISQFGDEIVVIGSRSQRTALETPVPVDVLTAEDFELTGMSETSRMIQFLAPSFNFSTSTISDGTDIVRPSTLRGLGPDQTLVLVNGKRRHNSALIHVNGSIGRGTAGVDLNSIPSSAIERVEVLRDGAAAQYGSDAIAGVINVQLRSRAHTSIKLYGGEHYEGDGTVVQGSVSHGVTVRESGHFNFAAEYRDRDWTNRAGLDPRRIFNFLEQEFGEPALSDGTLDPREQTYDRLNHRYGDAASENLYLFVNSTLPLGDSAEFYFFGGWSDRDGESAGFNRLPSQSRTNLFIHPEGHLPLINTEVDDLSFSIGARRNWTDWSLDANLTTGHNEFEFIITNSANTSLGPNSPDNARAGGPEFAQTTLGLDLYGSVDWGMELPVNIAVGAELREDEYELIAGEPASWIDGGFPDQFGGRAPAGIQVFPGFRPSNAVDESRDTIAVYGDVELNPSDRFLLGFAARYEDYSDFGDTLNGKLALRYEVSDGFALRGAAATGFRAPSLHQANFNNISTQFVDVGGVITPLEVGTFRVESPVARALGARPLEEETSVSFSAGFAARPMRKLSITADVFSIDIDDRIVLSGRFDASNPQIGPLLAPFGVNAAQFFTNAIDTETEGADLVVAYSTDAGDGTLSFTGAANWNETERSGPVRTPDVLQGLGETLFPFIDEVYLELAQPREAYNLSGRYSRRNFSVLARLNKFGAVSSTESNTDPTAFQTFTSKWLANVDFTYTFDNGLSLSVGANNLFDELPDRQIARNSFNGIFVFPRRTAPFGFNGGFWYTRVGFDF